MGTPPDPSPDLSAAELDLGTKGERAALRAYLSRGYRPVATNWRCPIGEIDLVIARDGVLVFCEVKTRRGSVFGGPFDAVTRSKQRKLRALATAFLCGPDARGFERAAVRFDVASVTPDGSGGLLVELFDDAF
jgi:putative endonuclease